MADEVLQLRHLRPYLQEAAAVGRAHFQNIFKEAVGRRCFSCKLAMQILASEPPCEDDLLVAADFLEERGYSQAAQQLRSMTVEGRMLDDWPRPDSPAVWLDINDCGFDSSLVSVHDRWRWRRGPVDALRRAKFVMPAYLLAAAQIHREES